METNRSIELYPHTEIAPAVESFGTQLTSYLDHMGLPKDNVLVPFNRRSPVFQNMPIVLNSLTDELRS